MTLTLDRNPKEHSGFQTYIPEDFANFEVYNANLEGKEGFLSCSYSRGSQCGAGSRDRELSRSPTGSSCTSGYFSHSASNATLSDMPFSASESSDHLSCTSRDQDPLSCAAGRGCTLTKSGYAESDTQQPVVSAGMDQDVLVQRQTSSSSIVNCTNKQEIVPLPHNCVLSASPEFTDFKGADESIGESDLAQFSGWEQEGLKLSTNQQRKPENVETFDTGNQHFTDVSSIINKSKTDNAFPAKYKYNEDCVSEPLSCPNTTIVCTSVEVPVSAPDKASSPARIIPAPSIPPPASPSSVTTPSTARALRAGGEPPIQEPAQGDLPHGSPCPSPNPSSAEPSGDSSGDESTPAAQLPDWMAPGEQVWVGKRRGTVHYVGGVEFAKGIWIGVRLDMAVGEYLETTTACCL